jgi:hypothetical protein
MAYGDTFHPAGITRDVKVRGPVWVGVMSVITLGIYAIYWFYATAKDLSEYGKSKGEDLGQNPTMSLMAILFGWILLAIPTIIALVRFTKRAQRAQVLSGRQQSLNGWLCLVMCLVGLSPVYHAYVQSELNKAWASEGGPVEGAQQPSPALTAAPQGPTATSRTSSEQLPGV